MKDIEEHGSGCANCHARVRPIEDVTRSKGIEIRIKKGGRIPDIAGYGMMATPGAVIDGVVVHTGAMPARAKVPGRFCLRRAPARRLRRPPHVQTS